MIGSILTIINDLGIGSLQRILSYLRFVEKLKMLLVSKFNAQLAQEIFDSEPFDMFRVQDHFSAEELKQLLIDYGSYVKRLRYTEWFSDETTLVCARLLPEYCSNLQEIHFADLEVTMTNIYGQILSSAQETIEILTLESCTVTDPACALVANLSKLKVLNLPRSDLSGNDFGRLKNLTELNLRECKNFLEEHFRDILNSNKLVKLNLRQFFISTNIEDMLLKTQPNLKVLTISHSKLKICKIKSLREVTMDLYYTGSDEWLIELVNNRVPVESFEITGDWCLLIHVANIPEIIDGIIQLDYVRALSFRNSKLMENLELVKIAKFCRNIEMLDLYGTSVGDLGIIESLEYFKQLRHLGVAYCNVKKSLYSRLVDIRKELGFVQKLVVYIWPQMELEAILKIREYIINKKYLQLSSKCFEELNKYELLKEETSQSESNVEPRQPFKKELDSSKPSIIEIPGSCLQRIASYLQPMDKLIFACLHNTICVSIATVLDSLLHNLNDIARIFTLSEARNLFAACAGHIKRMQFSTIGSTVFTDYINLLQPYCSYLIEIDITWRDNELCEEVMTLFGAKDLKLQKLTVKESLSVHLILKYLASTPSVGSMYSLNVSESHFNGQYIDAFKHLTDLNLMNCTDIGNGYFQSICRNCKLKRLNIIGVPLLSESSYNVLVNTQNDHLEQLSMSCRYGARNYTKIAKLKNLIHITSEIDLELSNLKPFLKMLVRYHRHDLEFIEINLLQNRFGIETYDMVEEVKSYFRNLKNITIKDDEKRELYCWTKNNEK